MGNLSNKNTTKNDEISNNSRIELITIQELYNTQCDLRSFYLLIDIRTFQEYSFSHIDLSLSFENFQLPENYRINKACDLIIYGENILQCQQRHKEIQNFFINNNFLENKLIFLNDSFLEYQRRFPYLCSNHLNYLEGRLFPSQIEQNVFLSNYGVASNPDILKLLGITHILNCTIDCPFADSTELENEMTKPSQYQRLRVPVVDERDQQISNYFNQAITFIENALKMLNRFYKNFNRNLNL